MTSRSEPPNLASLNRRIRNAASDMNIPEQRLRRSIAHTIVGQMLPVGVVKGGVALRMRVSEAEARLTADLDFSPSAGTDPQVFADEFDLNLADGWAGFTGRLVTKRPAAPPGVPLGYVMQPFEVKLSYQTRSWCTVVFELGHDEAGSTDDPDLRVAADLVRLFRTLGLPEPQPIPVMSVAQQAAQKLHACTSATSSGGGNDRAHDLVDLQILHRVETIDPVELNRVAPRLFTYRQLQSWPPVVVAHATWGSLYDAAAEGLAVYPTLEEAVTWANDLIAAAVDGTPAPPVAAVPPST